MDEAKKWYGIYQKDQHGLLNGPYGIIGDRMLAEEVAKKLYDDRGFVKITNPDHMEQWGFGNRKHEPFAKVLVGNSEVALMFGEHPHSRNRSNIYAKFESGNIHAFDGHRLLHDISFHDYNYLKDSELSGQEVRKGGRCIIKINGFVMFDFFYRDVEAAMLKARELLNKVEGFSIRLWDPKEREEIVGRKVYYHDFPAKIESLTNDGAVMLKADHPKGEPFPFRAWQIEEKKSDRIEPEIEFTIKDDIFSPHIWWWRD